MQVLKNRHLGLECQEELRKALAFASSFLYGKWNYGAGNHSQGNKFLKVATVNLAAKLSFNFWCSKIENRPSAIVWFHSFSSASLRYLGTCYQGYPATSHHSTILSTFLPSICLSFLGSFLEQGRSPVFTLFKSSCLEGLLLDGFPEAHESEHTRSLLMYECKVLGRCQCLPKIFPISQIANTDNFQGFHNSISYHQVMGTFVGMKELRNLHKGYMERKYINPIPTE